MEIKRSLTNSRFTGLGLVTGIHKARLSALCEGYFWTTVFRHVQLREMVEDALEGDEP